MSTCAATGDVNLNRLVSLVSAGVFSHYEVIISYAMVSSFGVDYASILFLIKPLATSCSVLG